jgi:hypothetical protein
MARFIARCLDVCRGVEDVAIVDDLLLQLADLSCDHFTGVNAGPESGKSAEVAKKAMLLRADVVGDQEEDTDAVGVFAAVASRRRENDFVSDVLIDLRILLEDGLGHSDENTGAPAKAYEQAEIAQLPGGLWHTWRRKWATERKDLPLKDVAAAGGWRDFRTLLRSYQQVDSTTIVRVVLEGRSSRRRGSCGKLPQNLPH